VVSVNHLHVLRVRSLMICYASLRLSVVCYKLFCFVLLVVAVAVVSTAPGEPYETCDSSNPQYR
jgi:hypothetical protein